MFFEIHVTLIDGVTGLLFDEILLFIGWRVWRLLKVGWMKSSLFKTAFFTVKHGHPINIEIISSKPANAIVGQEQLWCMDKLGLIIGKAIGVLQDVLL